MASPPDAVSAEQVAPTEQPRPIWSVRIGVIPLPFYALLVVVLAVLAWQDDLAADIPTMAALLGVCSYTCYEVGRRIPGFRSIGGPVILVTFLPAFLVAAQWIPADLAKHISTFYKSTNFLYVFIAGIIVGSILSMNRTVLIRGFLKIFVPLAAGSAAALVAGSLVGWAITGDLHRTVFFIVVPVMGGGLGEGAIPLTLGYAQSGAGQAETLLAQVLPVVLLANVCAIVFSSVLSMIGQRFPQTTGFGKIQPTEDDELDLADRGHVAFDIRQLAAAGFMAVALYLLGEATHALFGWPAPIVMLVAAILLKLSRWLPRSLEHHSGLVYGFMSTAVTYPLLFAIGVSSTPWNELLKAFTVATVITIVATVGTMMATAFLVGRWIGMYPVDTAIVVGTHTGMGGTGDVAILSATRRMALMPFAQIATRIGGAITVTVALIAHANLY
ncbi:2-hydroxycarboxylate transporter family protein [Saccharopolyspora spinosa]|uniref:Na+/citrate or Na+/malate symporter n=1 Tax=Saccharopolyspora spinosa TaxID=60894 RepID=A0A2N3XVZ1_SACSN|nr:2-hydroxycarboxylate transporter family protein [Saccharopolyspora spinosa]PKW14780.1 Na+/citrate or Na+/malate symporter [Saccharopolyspora spinosa]